MLFSTLLGFNCFQLVEVICQPGWCVLGRLPSNPTVTLVCTYCPYLFCTRSEDCVRVVERPKALRFSSLNYLPIELSRLVPETLVSSIVKQMYKNLIQKIIVRSLRCRMQRTWYTSQHLALKIISFLGVSWLSRESEICRELQNKTVQDLSPSLPFRPVKWI